MIISSEILQGISQDYFVYSGLANPHSYEAILCERQEYSLRSLHDRIWYMRRLTSARKTRTVKFPNRIHNLLSRTKSSNRNVARCPPLKFVPGNDIQQRGPLAASNTTLNPINLRCQKKKQSKNFNSSSHLTSHRMSPVSYTSDPFRPQGVSLVPPPCG
jgi:hypothetical protein